MSEGDGEASEEPVADRRPIRSRETRVARRTAGWLARCGVSPDLISVSGAVFAVLAGVLFWWTAEADGWVGRGCFLAGAVLVQLRLLANLFDGMVALQIRAPSKLGDVFNEVPDRVSDVAILVGFGIAAGSVVMGLVVSVLAMAGVYLRAFRASLGGGQDYGGPMAKAQRMAVVTVAAVYLAVVPDGWRGGFGPWVLWLLVVGVALTCVLRLWRTVVWLRSEGGSDG